MTFLEAYIKHGHDVELIAQLLAITPPEADRLINQAMYRLHDKRMEYSLQSDVRRPAWPKS